MLQSMGAFNINNMKELTQVAEITISYKPTISHRPKVVTSLDAYVELRPFFANDLISLQEEFIVMYLSNNSNVLGVYKLSKGGLTGTVADTRLILATGLKAAACCMILCHNHPSGNLKPSNADIDITRKIKEAASMMDIRVLDHIIISPAELKYFSFADEGLV